MNFDPTQTSEPKFDRFILDVHGVMPLPEPDQGRWRKWCMLQEHQIQVAHSHVGYCCIKTVFTGTNLNFDDDGPPLLWQTDIIGGSLHGRRFRCPGSREQAEAQHEKIVQLAKDSEPWHHRLRTWLRRDGQH